MRSAAASELYRSSWGSPRSGEVALTGTTISAVASGARTRLPARYRTPTRRLCRRKCAQRTLVDTSYQHAIPPQRDGQGLGFGWGALLLICTTLMCLASAATAFILLLRPLLLVRDFILILQPIACPCGHV